MLFQVVLVLIVIWYIIFHIKRRRLYELAEQFEGPKPLPLIGNVLKCMIPVTDIIDTVLKNRTAFKSPIRFWFGPYLVLYITDPEDIRIILNSPHAQEKLPYMYKLYESVLGRGLVTLPVDNWKRHRKLISPNFNQTNLRKFLGTFIGYSENLVHSLRSIKPSEIFDVEHYFVQCTLNTVLDTLLGFEANDVNAERARTMIDILHSIFSGSVGRMSNVWLFSDVIFKMSSQGKKFMQAKEQLTIIIDSIVEEWKSNFAKQHNQATASSRPVRFVEHMVLTDDELGKLTAEELREEIQTLIIAGFETTASAMSFFMVMLGMHPDIQENIYQEIQNVLSTKTQPNADDLNKFDLLDRAIKETMRLFPALVGGGRYTDTELKIKNGIIPANTNIVFGVLSVHRDPNIWPNPNKYDPDRFLPENEAKRHPCSWLPFSFGPRNCIGVRYAWIALKVMSINMICNYKINTVYKCVEDVKLTTLMGVKPTNGYKISITAR